MDEVTEPSAVCSATSATDRRMIFDSGRIIIGRWVIVVALAVIAFFPMGNPRGA
jgi:hypothetical protein